jgi:DNA topoisomerase-1
LSRPSKGTSASAKALVIVESPAKAKTINKYLGRGYVVKACRGHVRDLPPHQYGIDPGRNFEPTYEIMAGSRKIVEELKQAAEQAPVVYLATDLDREGEAIAWHLAYALELPPEKIRRVVFNEITKIAVTEAFAHPREINMAKVDAQQARRILDRVVGYELSPLLWKKVAKGLSAGRVQSVAVQMIVGREAEIRAFEPRETWAIGAIFAGDSNQAAGLTAKWKEFLTDKASRTDGPSAEQRADWLSRHACFRAELVEFPEGQAFRPTGRVEKRADGSWAFASAVDQAAEVARLLGCRIQEASREPRKEYPHFNQFTITLTSEIDCGRAAKFAVRSLETKRRTINPSAPFTTATLQQAAANQLRFGTSKTMKIAQALYEGIDIETGEGNVGLITYMRTDSTNLSADAVQAVRKLIRESFGDRYVPGNPNRYGSSKKAQEAHEAIRPTDVTRTPAAMKGHMTPDQHKLYALIWNRFVACQTAPAEWDTTTARITAETRPGPAVFKATGRVLVFDGFYKVMGVPQGDPLLPAMKRGQAVAPIELLATQKYTSPPPRYGEASLVKALEAEGIGRPSTYAAIIKTIQGRGYVEQEDRRFRPTARGEIVTEKLVTHFPKIMDVRFTSHVEDELDKIEDRDLDWHDVLHEFYDPFKESLARAHAEMEAVRAEPSDYTCEACGEPMVYRFGKNGRFLSCTGYPACKVAKNVDEDGKIVEPVEVSERCEVCGRAMILRKSRRGPFLGCSGYPACTYTKPCTEDGVALKKVEAADIKEACLECGAPMKVKFSRGRSFLGCGAYPQCKATASLPDGVYVEKPKPEPAGVRCDKCGRPVVIRKSRRGPFLSCSGFPKCRNALPMDKLDHLKELEAAGKIPAAPSAETLNGNGSVWNGNGQARGKATRLTAEDLAALGPPPPGFAWTRTGRPVVEAWPEGSLTCFECGGEMILKTGRFGPFFTCANCRASANLRGEAKKRGDVEMPAPARPKPIETDVACPDCSSQMLLRMGRTGRFLGCSSYPKCKKTMEAPAGLLREVAAS